MLWKKDDIIILHQNGEVVERKILKVLKRHYLWCYTDMPDKIFDSNNSSDPGFEVHWELKTKVEEKV